MFNKRQALIDQLNENLDAIEASGNAIAGFHVILEMSNKKDVTFSNFYDTKDTTYMKGMLFKSMEQIGN